MRHSLDYERYNGRQVMQMTDSEKSQNDNSDDQSSAPAGVPLKSGGEVRVTYLESPPPAGEKVIHPRRQAPIIPEHRSAPEV
jgi:hypothetical protein